MYKKHFVRRAAAAGTALAAVVTIISGSAAHAQVIATVPMPACIIFERSLFVGARGSDVSALQEYLHNGGYLSVAPTGYFGAMTEAAVASWQEKENLVAKGGYGSGYFGSRSRAHFGEWCGSGPTESTTFTANPSSGAAPLTVQFTDITLQGGTPGATVNFGDGTSDTLKPAPTFSAASSVGIVTHTYSAPGTYTATLMNNPCANDPAGTPCTKMAMMLGSVTVTVTAAPAPATSTANILQMNAPGSVALHLGDIAEVRNANFYFTLAGMTGSAATINITQVGCWNSFPSDPAPVVRCMLAVALIPPQTLSLGQAYALGAHTITLSAMSSDTATFAVQ